ncbi:hypothetical protein GJ699_27660 [Duganella sp. FT80W]|uniref:PEP-CTERM sorting domain-containing protein n=1 Tax=Duganella guangzhouensis TaxID=2666084 RepID=A0A6I2L6L1_9BURK|nr:hypothetical protein [Duganella guangzhouensis]MRW93778.1 hypothetical protein [Duganella guangzhouensis]
MNRLSVAIFHAAVLASSPAWAIRAHDYIDDQRSTVTLPSARAPEITVEAPPAAPTSPDEQLVPPKPPANATAQAAASPVPELSGAAMLGCGLLLLLLQPVSRSDGIRVPEKNEP